MKCRHCGHTPANRPRRLCWTCFKNTAIRARYGHTSKYAKTGWADVPELPEPPEPTDEPPGTEAKIRVMRKRASDGYGIFHESDAAVTGLLSVHMRMHGIRSQRAIGSRVFGRIA